jgi:signal transduction histidine kinase
MPMNSIDAQPRSTDIDFPMVVATMPINASQQYAALTAIIFLSIVAIIEVPFAQVQLAKIDAFIPVLQTTMCIVDLITAILLFAQYSIQPRPALVILGSGYIASGLFAFLQTLAFPGAYAANGILGGNVDSPGWFFVWWHLTFPAAVLTYALLKDWRPAARGPAKSTASVIAAAVACAMLIVAGLSVLATAGVGYLPALYSGGVTRQTAFANYINMAMWAWGATAFAIVCARRRTILDLWLGVTLFAWMPNFIIAAFVTSVRFSVAWYTARGFTLVASCIVLAVLLTETTVLYGRLTSALVLLRRERANRLLSLDVATSAMAHEIRSPLSVIEAESSIALTWLGRSSPNLEELRTSLFSIVEATERAAQVLSSVRMLFGPRNSQRTLVHSDDLVREVLRLLQHDIQANGISLTTDYQGTETHIDRVQLQQVVLNLIKNAIEAMSTHAPDMRRLRLSTRLYGKSEILLSFEDTGPGVTSDHQQHIFTPFFTTKPAGMGLGLAICQTIVEAHNGRLYLAKTDSHGSVFEIVLPTTPQTDS